MPDGKDSPTKTPKDADLPPGFITCLHPAGTWAIVKESVCRRCRKACENKPK